MTDERPPPPSARHATRPVLALLLLAALATGCGDRDAPSAPDEAPPEPPTEVIAGTPVTLPCDTPSLWPRRGWLRQDDRLTAVRAGTLSWSCPARGLSGEIIVRPGLAATLALPPLPPAVPLGRSLVLEPRVLDAFGNPIDAAERQVEPANVALVPQTAARLEGDRWRFLEPGTVEISASAAGLETVRHTLLVDAGAPRVELDEPARGTIVRRSAMSSVRVAGRVIEDGPQVTLTVDGRPVEVGPDGRFETSLVPSATGLSVLRYEAVDQVGNHASGARALLFGPLRDPAQGLDQAARVFLPRSMLDDDQPDLDDVAAAIELLMGIVKVPDQRISFGCQGHVELSRIRLDADGVDLVPTAQGLQVAVRLKDVSVNVSGQACACVFGRSAGCVSARGSVATPRVSASIAARIGASSPTSVQAAQATIDIAPLQIHWDFLWGGLDWAIELFEREIRQELIAALRETLTERVQANLQTVLDTLVPPQTLSLPPPLSDEVTLQTRLVGLVPSVDGLGFDIATRTLERRPRHDTATRTRLQTVRASTTPPELPSDRLGIAVSLDIVNDAIFNLWSRGALDELEVDLGALGLPQTFAAPRRLTLGASLPPMLLPGRRDGSLQLVVGDLHVLAELPFETLELYVSLLVEARFWLDESDNSLVIELVRDGLELHFEPASPDDAATLAGSLFDVSRLITAIVTRTLVGRTVQVALPVMDLSLVPGIPKERSAVLQLGGAQLTVSRSGYLVVTGEVRAQK